MIKMVSEASPSRFEADSIGLNERAFPMKRTSIATRIVSGFGLIAAIFMVVAMIVVFQSRHMAAVTQKIEVSFTPRVDAIVDLNDAIQRIRIHVRSAIIETEPAALAAVARHIDESISAADGALQRIEALEQTTVLGQDVVPESRSIREQLQRFEGVSRDVTRLATQGSHDEANRLFHEIHGPSASTLNEATRAYIAQVRAANQAALEALQTSAGQMSRAVIGGATLFVLCASVIGFVITRSIRRKLADTLAAVQRIASGDLSTDLHP